jgi:hypothetical protein
MDKKSLLSLLWIFLTVNYIFCDVYPINRPIQDISQVFCMHQCEDITKNVIHCQKNPQQ